MEKTLVKGLDVLEAIARSPQPRGVTELAAALGITKSNAFRLLQTLVAAKFVQQDSASGLYSASPRLFELGMLVGARIDVRAVARPVLEEMMAASGENVSIGLLDGAEVLFIDRVDTTNPVRAIVRNGERLPAYASSCGKVLLAWADAGVVDSLDGRLTRMTARTVASLPVLKRDLARIREQGYAVAQGEWHLEISSVAAPIRGRAGEVVSALMISGPTARFTDERIARFVGAVRDGAERISRMLP